MLVSLCQKQPEVTCLGSVRIVKKKQPQKQQQQQNHTKSHTQHKTGTGARPPACEPAGYPQPRGGHRTSPQLSYLQLWLSLTKQLNPSCLSCLASNIPLKKNPSMVTREQPRRTRGRATYKGNSEVALGSAWLQRSQGWHKCSPRLGRP